MILVEKNWAIRLVVIEASYFFLKFLNFILKAALVLTKVLGHEVIHGL